MTYTEKTLGINEHIVSIHKPSKWALVLPFGIACIFYLLSPAISIGIMLYSIIELYTTEYSITTKKILFKKGWIIRRSQELYITKVEGVEVDQGILGRIFGFGNLIFEGVGSKYVIFVMIPDPLKRKIEVQELIL
jgi:uncharacterized membrane protein YdbT with pleckstrin-like domain